MNTTGPILEIIAPYIKGEVKTSGESNIVVLCPFHNDKKPSFAINLNNGLWICHGCGLSGSLPSFLKMVGLGRSLIDALLGPLREELDRQKERHRQTELYKFKTGDPFLGDVILPEEILGTYEYKPKALINRDFDPKLLRRLEIGYDRSKDRITFPIRDLYGNLVGVSGRTTINEEPRYKVYSGGRYVRGKFRTGDFGEFFDKEFPNYKVESHKYLWNAHEVYPIVIHSRKPIELVIVEGYKACLWLVQNGWPNTVALMGSSITRTQADIVRRMTDTAILFLDYDKAGRAATYKIGKWLSKSIDVKVCQPSHPMFKQPDYLSQIGLEEVFHNKMRFERWTMKTSTKNFVKELGLGRN